MDKSDRLLEEFKKHLGKKAHLNLSAVSLKDVRAFRDLIAQSGHAPTTVNGTMKILSVPFNAALRLGYIPVNPCLGVDALRDDAHTEKDVFTAEQVEKLIEAAAGDWRGVILTAYYTGLRLRDVVDLKWDSFDFENSRLKVKTSKTGAEVEIPLHPEIVEWLKTQPRGIGKAAVFPTLTGKTGGGKSGLSMAFKRIIDKAGIKGRVLRQKAEDGAGRTQSSLSFHSLRHSFNSALANNGIAQEIRQKLTGHATAKMNSKYTHGMHEQMKEAVNSIPGLKKAK